jgi:hypothetical protein
MLQTLSFTDKHKKTHKLHANYSARFLDSSGNIVPKKVRNVYMLAGIVGPEDDSDLLKSIESNIVLLNCYMDQFSPPTRKSSFKKTRSPKSKKSRDGGQQQKP